MKLDKLMAAIVTGGASGLGEATPGCWRRSGAKVALLDMNAERGRALAEEIGGDVLRGDVTDEASMDMALARRAPQRHRAHPGQLRRHRARQAHGREKARDRRADPARVATFRRASRST